MSDPNERLAFLRAIIENPADETVRLVFADWLDERDDPWGRFIRVQFALADPDTPEADRAGLRKEEAFLLARHGKAWAQELLDALNRKSLWLRPEWLEFEKGAPVYLGATAKERQTIFRLHRALGQYHATGTPESEYALGIDCRGNTLLHYACRHFPEDARGMAILVNYYGQNSEVKNLRGETPMDHLSDEQCAAYHAEQARMNNTTNHTWQALIGSGNGGGLPSL